MTTVGISIRFSWNELHDFNAQQIQALMRGVVEVVTAEANVRKDGDGIDAAMATESKEAE